LAPIRLSIGAALLAAVGVVASITPAAQAAAAKESPLPNPCATFTTTQAQAVFGGHPHLTKTKISGSSYKTCIVAAGTRSVHITVSRAKGAVPPHAKCYAHASLGAGGRVCVSTSTAVPGTTASLAKNGIHVADFYSVTTGRHGRALYLFAVDQHKSLR
jgi:hypothetical protein